MDYRKIRSAEDLIKVGYGESLPLEAKPSPDRSDASNVSNMLSETMTGPIVNLKYKILDGDIEGTKAAFNELITAWESAMDSIHAVSGNNSYEYTADQADYMLDSNEALKIQASLKRKANPSDPVAWERELRDLQARIEAGNKAQADILMSDLQDRIKERQAKGWELIDIVFCEVNYDLTFSDVAEDQQDPGPFAVPWARMRKPGFEGGWVYVSPAGQEDFRF